MKLVTKCKFQWKQSSKQQKGVALFCQFYSEVFDNAEKMRKTTWWLM